MQKLLLMQVLIFCLGSTIFKSNNYQTISELRNLGKKVLFYFFYFYFYQGWIKQTIIVSASTTAKKIDNFLELPASVIAMKGKHYSVVSENKINFFSRGKFVKKNQLLIELIDSEEQVKLRQISGELDSELNYQRAEKLISKGNIYLQY